MFKRGTGSPGGGRGEAAPPGRRAACVAAAMAAALLGGRASAAEPCASVVGRLASVEGVVQVRGEADADWRAAELGGELCRQDTVRTGDLSRAAIALVTDEILRLDQDTTVRLAEVPLEASEPSVLDLVFGALQSFSRSPRRVDVGTPHMTLAIRGTEFVVRAGQGESVLTVTEGEVVASNAQGELAVPGGQSAVARPGQAPQPYLLVRPRDAVQWSLYYPPILSLAPGPGAPPELEEALALGRRGDVAAALASLDRLPDRGRGAQAQLYRAALLLSVGRVDEARAAIDAALAADPQAGLAYAQRAVINVAQNNKEEALADARRGVELAPDSAAARIALSYAQQASFDIQGARDTMLQATADQPDDALAWARLSEVWLMLGYRDRSREAAERAAALAPDLERVQTVRGFADLVEFRTGPAKAAFERAIALNSADPLPRFGLGLARIRDGALDQGREEIEVAVGLDPGNALLRTYLGRAYFEERRAEISGDQYRLAKDLDPLDPTAYLYDAIRLQTINRPVEALDQLERSIELNGNRAVYRSQLLLDQDRAARGASLSRIYQDLGFLERGVREATRSVTLDPTNAASHRFLSDVYGGVQRREISRVSELLQAQMLQDINIYPVQPAFAETNLNIVTGGGPATPGYSEFTPMFERNQVQLNGTGLVGNNDTLGGEAIASAIYGRYSLSAGIFGFDTDGWRENADLRHTIYDVFFQTAITPDLNAQLEFRRRDTHHGDIDMLWDPDDFSPDEERDLTQDSFRVGTRYSPSPNSDILLSLIYTDVNDKTFDTEDFGFGSQDIRDRTDEEGYQAEAQHLYRQDWYNITTGGAFNYVDSTEKFGVTQDGFTVFEDEGSDDITQPHPYVYSNINLPTPVTWTLGLSYDRYEQGPIETTRLNPKLGAQWAVNDDLILRAAAFQVVKPRLTTNRTLEPTQVAGFNQFYDDASGTAARRYGVGFDWRLGSRVYVGGEATWRDLDVQYFFGEDASRHTSWDEQTHGLYANWAPRDWVAFRAEFVYDRFHADESQLTDEFIVPEDLETISVPVGVNFFHPSGLFAGATTTYVHQDLDRSEGNVLDLGEGSDGFGLVDLRLGYRFPKRYGLVTFQVNNLFDKSFNYQDNSFSEFQDAPSAGPYIPERQVWLYLTLSW